MTASKNIEIKKKPEPAIFIRLNRYNYPIHAGDRDEPEVWKPIPGFSGYEASSWGRLRSVDRVVTFIRQGKENRRECRGQILKACYNDRGRPCCTLVNDEGGARGPVNIHVAVAMAFLGHVPDGGSMHVCHQDDDKRRNVPTNLRVQSAEDHRLEHSRGPYPGVSNRDSRGYYYISLSAADAKQRHGKRVAFLSLNKAIAGRKAYLKGGLDALEDIRPKASSYILIAKYRQRKRNPWAARVRVPGGGKTRYEQIGSFSTEDEAVEARAQWLLQNPDHIAANMDLMLTPIPPKP